jgi:hypothetical protein
MNKLLMLMLACLISTVCSAQGYTPLGKMKKAAHTDTWGYALYSVTPSLCKTSDIPTWDQLKTKKFETHMQYSPPVTLYTFLKN